MIGKGYSIKDLESQCTNVGLGYLDLALIHSAGDFDDTNFVILWTHLSKKPDKYHRLGLSNIYINRLKQLQTIIIQHNLRPIEAIENEMRPGIADEEFVEYCKKQNPYIHLIAYSTLKQNSNAIRTLKQIPDALKYNNILDKLSWAQIALKWATQKGITVIPSSNNIDNMHKNIKIVDIPDFEDGIIKILNNMPGYISERSISAGFKASNNIYIQ